MPTGYTEIIERKPDLTFREFALRCARAFGALIMMRDDSMDAEIPEKFEPSTYHRDQLEEAKKRLTETERMTLDEARKMELESHQSTQRSNKKYMKEYVEKNALYQRMLDKVNSWKPPSNDHVRMKEFMVEQIDTSMGKAYQVKECRYSPKEWRDREIADAKHDVEYHEKEWKEELDRTKVRNKWLSDLKSSLDKFEE